MIFTCFGNNLLTNLTEDILLSDLYLLLEFFRNIRFVLNNEESMACFFDICGS